MLPVKLPNPFVEVLDEVGGPAVMDSKCNIK